METKTKRYSKQEVILFPFTEHIYIFFICLSKAVMNELNSYSFFLRTVISMYMGSLGVELFMTRTVHEVLWGFKDPLLTKIHSLKPDVDEYFGLMWKVSRLFKEEENYLLFSCFAKTIRRNDPC